MPSRRARHPLVAVAIVALSGTVALEALWLGLDALDDDAIAATAPPSETPPVELPTPLLSLRRAPSALSRSASSERLRFELGPLLADVGEDSCLQVAVDGQTIVAEHADLPAIPGSNEKLPIAAAALELLGPEHVFTTEVRATMSTDGAVAGDLALVGGGDPLLSTSWYEPPTLVRYPQEPATSLEALADEVVAAGVRSITGSVVGDESRYDTERYAPFLDPSLHKFEVGPLSALMVNDGVASTTGVKGDDPALSASRLFEQLLRERGVSIGGAARTGATDASLPVIAAIDSAPLREIVPEMLTNSDNNTAELLVKELAVAGGATGTREAGLTAATQALTAMGLPMTGVMLQDGSGLGRGNQLTCELIVSLLGRYAADHPLRAGMAMAASTGTLAPEFQSSVVRGRLRAKTGSLTGVKALSGYLPVDGGSSVDFALILNAPNAREPWYYQPIWGRLAAAMATYPEGPTIDELAPIASAP